MVHIRGDKCLYTLRGQWMELVTRISLNTYDRSYDRACLWLVVYSEDSSFELWLYFSASCSRSHTFHQSIWTEAGVIAMICVDIIVTLPTLKKIWFDPHTEDSLAWLTTALSQACLVISLPFLTFENSFFWLYAVVANFTIAIFIRLRTRSYDAVFTHKIYTFFLSLKEKTRHTFFALKNKL